MIDKIGRLMVQMEENRCKAKMLREKQRPTTPNTTNSTLSVQFWFDISDNKKGENKNTIREIYSCDAGRQSSERNEMQVRKWK